MSTRVLVLGHSFIKRLHRGILNRWYPNLVQHLNLRQAGVIVRLLGLSGGNIDILLKDKQNRARKAMLKFPPDIVILQIGGNDLDVVTFDMSGYMEKVCQFIGILQTTYLVKKVVLCEIFPRIKLRKKEICPYVYHHGKYLIDQYFYLSLADHPSVNFWYHKSRLTAQKKLFLFDGIHLNVEGTRRFFKSHCGAVMSVL
ncbi:Hypothetical predicted protein [Mytilus galloprovincialis]|uniref:SGNH hydrolase-type esterase domain-containing protein n=1 Tax=Mytilus galloprovincialis TaxID=29158 RepID=A0A8B6GS73_MYTGA|nr:Hypothetical predicted protein [Mytilus galloprovincialis]